MKYILLTIAIVAALIAFFCIAGFIRVAIGKARFNNGASAVFNVVLGAACCAASAWLFGLAFA